MKGTIFALTEEETTIGREGSTAVHLNDPSVSRRHCQVRRTQAGDAPSSEGEPTAASAGSGWIIRDLESFNCTFVNGIPIQEHPLCHGDQIAIGDVVLLFLLHEEPGTKVAAPLKGEDLITRSTIRLRREDSLYLRPEEVLAELPVAARIARDLNTLFSISATVNTIRELGALQARLLNSIGEIIPAERAAILLTGPDPDQPTVTCGWTRIAGIDPSVRASQSITNEVLREGVALLSNDLLPNEGLGASPSLMEARICSVLCVPLIAFDAALGAIYLDTSDPAARFDEGHLQLLTAVAAIAAVALANARHFETLEEDNARLQREIELVHEMVGESEAMRAIYAFIGKVAPTDSTVLIRGESGTGKELAAHALHLNSARSAKPFVTINCATLTESLLESELFGHEKGAFTGAIAQKRGKLELADGGTMFLDEVGELTPSVQAKLLRVLQKREFERVGGNRPIKVDVRVITATNRDLEQAIKSGGFREDLYYRLNVISVVMPSLRERREDIPLLASYFVAAYSKKCKRKVSGISAEARSLLSKYDWPGNVRELENAIERAVVLGSTNLIVPEDLPETLLDMAGAGTLAATSFHEAVNEAKKSLIRNALDQASGNFTEAAKLLGIHPNNLHRLMRNLQIRIENPKQKN